MLSGNETTTTIVGTYKVYYSNAAPIFAETDHTSHLSLPILSVTLHGQNNPPRVGEYICNQGSTPSTTVL